MIGLPATLTQRQNPPTLTSSSSQPASVFATVHERVLAVREAAQDTKTLSTSEYNSLLKSKQTVEELQTTIRRLQSEDQSFEMAKMKREIELYLSRIRDLEEKSRRATFERDELKFKLENKLESNSSLRERISELEQENKQLRIKVQKLEADSNISIAQKTELEMSLLKQNSELSNKVVSYELNTNEVTNQLKRVEEKNRFYEKQIMQLESELARLSREYREKSLQFISSSNAEKSSFKFIHSADGSENDSERAAHLVQLREKSLALEEAKRKLESEQQHLRTSEKNLQEAQSQFDGEKSRLLKQAALKDSEIAASIARLEEASRKSEHLSQQLQQERDKQAALLKQVDGLKKLAKEGEDELADLKKEKASLLNDKRTLEMKASNFEVELHKLSKLIETRNADISQLESDLQSKNSRVASLQKQVTALEAENAELRKQVQNLEGEIKSLDSIMQSKSDKGDIQVLGEEIEHLQATVDKLKEQLLENEQNYQNKYEEYEDNLKELEKRNDELVKFIEELEEKVEALEQSNHELNDLSKKLICDNSTLQNRNDRLEQELAQYQQLPLDNPYESQLSNQLGFQLKRLIEIVSEAEQVGFKDEEIHKLKSELDSAVDIANRRLLMVEKTQIDKSASLSTVADAFVELEKVAQQGPEGS